MFNTRYLYTEKYNGKVWCINNALDTIVTRKNGKVLICCNCAWKFKKYILDNKKEKYIINVGTDVWNYMPVTYEEIMKGFHEWRRSNEGK